jgi:prepilin-type N-terminal cleavage/methylation domain-containing protein
MLQWFVHKSRGFTLIEMIVIVVVIGVLAAIAAPNLSQWLHQKQVDEALGKIDLALQETQSEAIKRNKSCELILARGVNPPLSGNCLLSNRTLEGVTLNHSAHHNPWKITFNFKGENREPANDGTLWLTSPNNNNVRAKCLVISFGIGLRRAGKYDALSADDEKKCITP